MLVQVRASLTITIFVVSIDVNPTLSRTAVVLGNLGAIISRASLRTMMASPSEGRQPDV
jgi:hypothetical protein